MKKHIIFLFYGEGGHKAEMERLLLRLIDLIDDINYIGLVEGKNVIEKINNYSILPMRSKYNKLFALLILPSALLYNTMKVLVLILKYKPKGIISIGPGSVLFPAVLCKIFNKKIVYIETSSRFNTKSFTGKFMYYLANKFYVQNAELLNLYPNADYAGLLL